ncbi:GxxExxY protein [Candidatus Poribacteria bacterium]|nr:GxxExxY protein [Candidatus Poribacteria bacterium]
MTAGLKDCDEALIDQVLTSATIVHSKLGPGLLESVCELALMVELKNAGVPAQRQVEIPVTYQGHDLGVGFRADIIVADCLLLEIKAVTELTDIHLAQVLTYLKLLHFKRGYLLNFNTKLLKEGIRRISI